MFSALLSEYTYPIFTVLTEWLFILPWVRNLSSKLLNWIDTAIVPAMTNWRELCKCECPVRVKFQSKAGLCLSQVAYSYYHFAIFHLKEKYAEQNAAAKFSLCISWYWWLKWMSSNLKKWKPRFKGYSPVTMNTHLAWQKPLSLVQCYNFNNNPALEPGKLCKWLKQLEYTAISEVFPVYFPTIL